MPDIQNDNPIVILDRSTYDNIVEEERIDDSMIYIVRETTDANPNILSLCLGNAIFSDVMDITADLENAGILVKRNANGFYYFDDSNSVDDTVSADGPTADTYQVPNKLFLVYVTEDEETEAGFYTVIAYLKEEHLFVDCCGHTSGGGGGGEQNVIVVDGADFPQYGAVNNYVYIVPQTKKIGVYDSANSTFKELFVAVGENMQGKSQSIASTFYTESFTGGTHAERFNDYTNNLVKGNYSHSGGTHAYAKGNNSFAFGGSQSNWTVAEGNNSFAFGGGSAIGVNSLVFNGQDVGNSRQGSAVGAGSIAMFGGTASGAYSFAHGCDSGTIDATGKCSFAFGDGLTHSYGICSFAFGDNVAAESNYSISMGKNIANTWNSFVVGEGLMATTNNQTVFGKYNLNAESADAGAIFVIGNGTSTTRNNALAIFPNSDIKGYGNISLPNGLLQDSQSNFSSPKRAIITSSNFVLNNNSIVFGCLPPTSYICTASDALLFDDQVLIDYTTLEINSVEVQSVTHCYSDTGFPNGTMSLQSPTPAGYSVLIVFKKGSSISTASALMPNFTSANHMKQIHLLNPDIDISSFDIIHIMLFASGFSEFSDSSQEPTGHTGLPNHRYPQICAVVSGFAYTPQPTS